MMKKMTLILLICLCTAMLAACGSSPKASEGTQATQTPTAAPADAAGVQESENAVLAQGDGEGADAGQGDAQAAVPAVLAPVSNDPDRPIDVDLTQFSGQVVYAQVYDMLVQPDAYLGQKVRMKGNFSYFQDPDTRQEYFAAVIADATACCAQGIEFEWAGRHAYPQDYPPLDTMVTVTGIFDTYVEQGNMYVRLIDADVSWQ